jgi:PAS domain S-box-containing protein
MKTVIIGGGKGCRAIIELTLGDYLTELPLEIMCVADPDQEAPGLLFARKHRIPTTADMNSALALPGMEMVIELTGQDKVLRQIYEIIPTGVKVIDHVTAHVFWDVARAREDERRHIERLERLEQRLANEKQFLQNVVDNIPDLLLVLDRDKRVLRTNSNFRRFANVNIEDSVGQVCTDLLSDTPLSTWAEATRQALDDVLRTGEVHSEIRFTPPPDEAYWEITRTPFKNEAGEVEYILCSWHRITEQVMLQREIESQQQQFKSFIDSAHDWISIKDLEGRYIIVNPACARFFGRRPEDFIGKRPEEMLETYRSDVINRHDQEVIDSDQHHTYDEVYQQDGRDRHFQTVRFPLKDYKGSTIGVCTIARDVTQEKELSDQLSQAAKLAAVGKLAAGVAHEINNPLTGILAYAEDLAEELDEDNALKGDVEVIIRETLRCRNIVRNLLDFARQDNPRLEEIQPVEVVDQALMLVKKLPEFRNISIIWEPPDEVPPILGDVRQLQQVILNLMLNAADAMQGKGNITLHVGYERRGARCTISVEDSGPGIPENLIDKIFEPFFSTKDTNGLGLAVSWGIVERHRGTMEVDTAENGGAVFRIVLPAARK